MTEEHANQIEPIIVPLSEIPLDEKTARACESSYRRGFCHAMSLAGDLVRDGATADDLDWLTDLVGEWRYDRSTHTAYTDDACRAVKQHIVERKMRHPRGRKLIEAIVERGYTLQDIAENTCLGFNPDGTMELFQMPESLQKQARKMLAEQNKTPIPQVAEAPETPKESPATGETQQ